MNHYKDLVHPASRFSNRAENYRKFRPTYSADIIPFLQKAIGLHPRNVVTDIGTGTGLFAELFLRNGNRVLGIEPNEEMRSVSEANLKIYPGFSSIAGSAEETSVNDNATDIVTIAQAVQWMDIPSLKNEVSRILKPGGHIIVADTIQPINTDLQEGYAQLKLQFSINPVVDALQSNLQTLFYPQTIDAKSFCHSQWLDFDSLKGLLLSTSGIPLPGHSSYDTMISSLVQLFVAYNHNGFVSLDFETRVYYTKRSLLL